MEKQKDLAQTTGRQLTLKIQMLLKSPDSDMWFILPVVFSSLSCIFFSALQVFPLLPAGVNYFNQHEGKISVLCNISQEVAEKHLSSEAGAAAGMWMCICSRCECETGRFNRTA